MSGGAHGRLRSRSSTPLEAASTRSLAPALTRARQILPGPLAPSAPAAVRLREWLRRRRRLRSGGLGSREMALEPGRWLRVGIRLRWSRCGSAKKYLAPDRFEGGFDRRGRAGAPPPSETIRKATGVKYTSGASASEGWGTVKEMVSDGITPSDSSTTPTLAGMSPAAVAEGVKSYAPTCTNSG